MDHGISNGPIKGLEDPHKTIYECEGHGLTSVILNKGIIKTLPRPTRVGVLVHFSSSTSLSVYPNRKMLTGSVQEAIRLGADGVSTTHQRRRRRGARDARAVRTRSCGSVTNGTCRY